MKMMQKESGRIAKPMVSAKKMSSKPSVATKGKAWGARHRAGIKK
jgi:hypothetical protein